MGEPPGLFVGPNSGPSQSALLPNSGVVVLPSRSAPAASSRSAYSAVPSEATPANAFEPNVVGRPATGVMSFSVNGTPWSGPGVPPAARLESAARAPSLASSASTSAKALSAGFTCSSRPSAESTASSAESSPRRIEAASSVAGV